MPNKPKIPNTTAIEMLKQLGVDDALDHGHAPPPEPMRVSIVRFDMSMGDIFNLMFKFAVAQLIVFVVSGVVLLSLFGRVLPHLFG